MPRRPSSGRQKRTRTPRQQPEVDLPQAHEHSASVVAAGAAGPCIYSLNNNKSHLFIPFRKGSCSVTSLMCSFAFLPHSTPWHVCASPVLLAGLCLWCVPTWAQVSLFGSLDLPFPGGSAPSSRAGPSGSFSLKCSMSVLGVTAPQRWQLLCLPIVPYTRAHTSLHAVLFP